MNPEQTLKAAIDKYRLSEPVMPDVKIALEKSRKDNLVRILKQNVQRTIFTTAVVSFFLWIKKFGVSISIVKSTVAVSTAVIISAGVITASGIYTTTRVIRVIHDNEKKIKRINEIKTDTVTEKPGITAGPVVLSYSVAVSSVESSDDISGSKAAGYTETVIRELCSIRGARAAININSLDRYHLSDRILTISIIKLDEGNRSSGSAVYRLSAKIINSSSSRVLMHESVMASGENEIRPSLSKLVKKISRSL